MSGIVTAINAGNALVSLALNALVAKTKYDALIQQAQAEGRDVTDEELASVQSENTDLTDETLAKLLPNGIDN